MGDQMQMHCVCIWRAGIRILMIRAGGRACDKSELGCLFSVSGRNAVANKRMKANMPSLTLIFLDIQISV